jgi:hypothetical protein
MPTRKDSLTWADGMKIPNAQHHLWQIRWNNVFSQYNGAEIGV